MSAEPRMSDVIAAASVLSPEELEAFTAKLVAAMKTVYDPEIPSMCTNSASSIRLMSPTTRM